MLTADFAGDWAAGRAWRFRRARSGGVAARLVGAAAWLAGRLGFAAAEAVAAEPAVEESH